MSEEQNKDIKLRSKKGNDKKSSDSKLFKNLKKKVNNTENNESATEVSASVHETSESYFERTNREFEEKQKALQYSSTISTQTSEPKNDEEKKTEKKGLFKKKEKKTEVNDSTSTDVVETGKKKKKDKKKRTVGQTIWLIVKILILLGLVCVIAVGIYVWNVIKKAEPIDTSDISSMLSQSSYLYDDQGEIIDTTYSAQNRTIVEISQVPKHVQQAFIALEDRKFETHHGINIIRICGAIYESLIGGGEISGTSTITQQLARNVFLTDTMSVRSIERKITEIYYALILEDTLTKDQIMEGYLNTINFGLGYGIQTVAQTYFSKDVSELTIVEAAALATLPQAPSYYALVKRIDLEYVSANEEYLICTDEYYGYVWNDACESRMRYCLATMLEMGYITQEEYDEAKDVHIKDIVNPNFDYLYSYEVNYFADYVIDEVISDLMDEYSYTYDQAYDLVYTGGLRIYTTLDSAAQASMDTQIANRDYFPSVNTTRYDSNDNILYADSDDVLLYDYYNYFDEDGVYTLRNDEYIKNDDGSITIIYKGRLAFYPVTYNDVSDVNLEFRNMYLWEDGEFYTILGGILNVPRKYKTLEENNNVTISADFFTDFPEFFTDDGEGNLSTKNYSLRTKTIQPQVAMTIVDNQTGAIKAMTGGRETSGRSILNRATSNFQPGSSIKPFSVYGAALNKSYELSQSGKYFNLWDDGFGAQGTTLYGNYITTASIIDDEPLTVSGRIWPKNVTNSYTGLKTFRQAIQQSINVCAVKIVNQVGVDYSYNFTQNFGITTLDDEYDVNLSSLSLGGTYGGVNTVEMAAAMATYANAGVYKKPYCYTKVTTRNGTILLETELQEEQVIDEGVAWIMRDVLQSVVLYGTPQDAQISGENVGGKTGTTDLQENLWFNGFTANYTGCIWIGTDVRVNTNGYGGDQCAYIWKKIMQDIPNALGGTYSSIPSNVVAVTIDSTSGLLPDETSTNTRVEYFTSGTEPTTKGTLTATVDVCSVSGKLATEYCDATNVIQVTGTRRPYKPSDKVEDIKTEVPHDYCDICDPTLNTTYKTYTDLEGNAIFNADGLRVMIRNADNEYVTVADDGTVTRYEQNADGTIKLDENKLPIAIVETSEEPTTGDGTSEEGGTTSGGETSGGETSGGETTPSGETTP